MNYCRQNKKFKYNTDQSIETSKKKDLHILSIEIHKMHKFIASIGEQLPTESV